MYTAYFHAFVKLNPIILVIKMLAYISAAPQ